ncbi:MAG TPA: SRPBCC family protein [Acidimicrobiales bacterium]
MTLTEKAGDGMTQDTDANRSTRWWLRQDSCSVVIEAPAAHLYDMVADLPRMGEWSPECRAVEWLDGSTGPAEGARFIGHNRGGPRGLLRWSRRGRVLTADPSREFAFATEEGGHEGVVWRYRFDLVEGGTRVTESYEVRRIPAWARIVDVPTNRVRELREGLLHTLGQLKTAAESAA